MCCENIYQQFLLIFLQPQPWYAERPESDNASASSGEVSNADSGRGASEEGENSLMNASMSSKLSNFIYIYIFIQ